MSSSSTLKTDLKIFLDYLTLADEKTMLPWNIGIKLPVCITTSQENGICSYTASKISQFASTFMNSWCNGTI